MTSRNVLIVVVVLLLSAVLGWATACSVGSPIAPQKALLEETAVVGCGPGSVCVTVTPVPSPTCPCPATATCPVGTPTPPVPTATPVYTPPPTPLCWDKKLDDIGVQIKRRSGDKVLIAGWTTQNGAWTNPDGSLAVPACAWQWIQPTLGGDHNVYGRVEDAQGNALVETFVLFWPDGYDTRQPEPDGWANIPMWGQGWNPNLGPGPYGTHFYGSDEVVGLGMPWNNHWSFFFVYRKIPTLQEIDRELYSRKERG